MPGRMDDEMTKIITCDVSKCNGCYNCQTVCKDEHVDNEWQGYAKPQPEIGQFWVHVKEVVGGTVPKVKSYYLPEFCNHCDKPACLDSCKIGAIYKRDDGFVIIDPDKCNGCGDCKNACPYDAIYANDSLNICQKCTGCAHLLDAGEKLPRCVEACPTDALSFGEAEDLTDFTTGADVLKPETGIGPRVYYRNIPGLFIAGTIFDPDEMEVVIGAKVRATNGGKTWHLITDDFGDFWFEDLAPGKYDVVIEAKGYEFKTFKDILLRESKNLGDIPLSPKKSLDEIQAPAGS
jgi:Fe-S-cluster-containing dehydrogenase component